MYTERQLTELEEKEYSSTEEKLAVMLLLLQNLKGDLEKELRDFYQKYGRDGVVTYHEARKWVSGKEKRGRLATLLLLFSNKFSKLSDDLEDQFKSLIKSVIALESDFFDVDLDTEKLLHKPWGADESNWSIRLSDDVNLWDYHVASDVKQSIVSQKQIDDVLEQLNKRFMTMERVLRGLSITESSAVGSLARKQVFNKLGIKKYRYYAREDERTCEQCGALHGLVFPISAYEIGVTASPLHPRCRCWEVPIVE